MEKQAAGHELFMVNCHAHIFAACHVPDKFLPLRLVRWLARKKHFLRFAWILNHLNPFSSNDILDKYVNFMRAGLGKTQEDVLKTLIDFYPPGTRFIVLTMDMDFMKAGKAEKPYEEQLDEIVALLPAYKDVLIPFVFADPRRPDLLNFVKKYISLGFKGIKIYPPLGYFPFDSRLDSVYEFAIANNLPVTTHCSTGGIYTREKRRNLPKINPETKEKMDWKGRRKYVDQFTDPSNFDILLRKYPSLKLCFGHFGGTGEMEKFLRAETKTAMESTWFGKIKKLLVEYPNTYADISYTNADMSLIPLINVTLQSTKYREKVLYGTDFYMNKIEGNECMFSVYLRNALGEDNFRQIAVDNPEKFLK